MMLQIIDISTKIKLYQTDHQKSIETKNKMSHTIIGIRLSSFNR